MNGDSLNPGLGEIDYLSGGSGADRFILGTDSWIAYDDRDTLTDGSSDCAYIDDFNASEDKIQLRGAASNYLLQISGSDTNLYIDKIGSEPDELIAVFGDTTGLDLTSVAFEYVPLITEITFTDNAYSVNENGTASITLVRNGNLDMAVSATVLLNDGTAQAPEDYTNTPIAVTFAAGETSKTITVPIIDDSAVEPNETINLQLTSPTGGATLGSQNTATLTIVDNDFSVIQPGILQFSAPNFQVNEDGTPIVVVTITRSGGSGGSVSATVTLTDGTATSGADYINTPISVVFANGETSKTITVPIIDDSVVEPNETINLQLTSPTGGATLGSQNTATLTIVDNDPSGPGPDPDPDPPLVILPGMLQFSAPNFQVREDGTPIFTVTITRSGGSDGSVSATVTLTDGTATSGADYINTPISVVFANGETSKTITVPIIDDSAVEPNETINLQLTSPTGGATLGSQNTATLTIVDNDFSVIQPGILQFSAPNFQVNEDGTPIAAVTITRSGGSDGSVSATIDLTDGTATAGADYTNTLIVVTFANNEISKTISIPIIDDARFEPNETINLRLINPTGGVTFGSRNTATLTIIDDDAPLPGTLQFNTPNFQVNEDGTPIAAVTITRSGGSDGGVSATVSLSDGTATAGSDYTNTPILVAFADGETSKTINIPILDDTLYELNELINLTLNTPTGGAILGSQTTAALTIINNDALTILTPVADQTIAEDSLFTFSLPANLTNAASNVALTYSPRVANGDPLPNWLTFNPTNRQFSGTPTNDAVGTLAIAVTVSDGTNSISDTFNLTITNTNDAPVVVTPIADQTTPEDFFFSQTIGLNTFADIDIGDSLSYTARLSNGQALPTWLSFNSTTRTLSGTPADPSSLNITITATDTTGASASDTFNITITPLNPLTPITPTNGNDTLLGTNGNDILTAANLASSTPGRNEKDTLTGGAGRDIFVLGDQNRVFYDDISFRTPGTGDYARITDFNPTQDLIQLHGSASDYSLGTSPIATLNGTALFYTKNQQRPELIAILQGTAPTDLTTGFKYV